MSYHRYTSTGPPQQPARSILKPSRSSHPTSASLSSGSLPAVKVRDPPIPTQASQRAVQSLQDVPLEGPIPAIYFPPTQNRQQLLTLLHQFTTQLEADGAGKDLDCKREKISRPQGGRPTYQADGFPEFRMILMGPWAPGPCYGPVLEPRLAMKLPTLRINRCLAPPLSATNGLHWDVTQPVTSAKFMEDGKILNFEDFCKEPATSPRITQFQMISKEIPWPFMAIRTDKMAGVTVGDVLSNLSLALLVSMSDYIVRSLSEDNRAILLRAHQKRCPDKAERPKPFDLLAGCTTFGGLTYDREREEQCNFSDQKWEIHCFIDYLHGST